MSEDVAVTGARDPGHQSEDRHEHTVDLAQKSTITPVVSDFHPAANIFPLMEEGAIAELATDIAANGLREPIWRHRDGRIVDGRNRWLACSQARVECRHRTYERDDETIVPFVVSKNLHRRHLTTGQRGAVAADIATLEHGQRADRVDTAIAVSQPQAAKLLNVSVDSLQRAAAVKRADPDLHEKVKAGEMTAGQARAVIAESAAADPPAAEPDRVEFADARPDVGPAPVEGARAFEAISAVARLKISGTAAARDYEWTDADIMAAEKAAKWLRKFVQVAKRERARRQYMP